MLLKIMCEDEENLCQKCYKGYKKYKPLPKDEKYNNIMGLSPSHMIKCNYCKSESIVYRKT